MLDNNTSDLIIYLVLQINSYILHGNINTKNEDEKSKHNHAKPDIWPDYPSSGEMAKYLSRPEWGGYLAGDLVSGSDYLAP
jgi:hypothetical protein